MLSVTKLGTKMTIKLGADVIESTFGVGDLLLHTQVDDRSKAWQKFIITGINFKQTYDKKRGLEGGFVYTCIRCEENPEQVEFTQTWLYDRLSTDYTRISYKEVNIEMSGEFVKNTYINLQNNEKKT